MRVTHPTDRPNFSEVHTNRGIVGFSYETPIAFSTPATGWTVRKNDWGPTTGKHLNYYPTPHNERLTGSEFLRALENAGLS
ncbi:MAG: hypothetical protein V3U14_13040 [candidate division NC10 bacterium]